jgi:RNA polymerase sigma-70 factor (ECF subfamily)
VWRGHRAYTNKTPLRSSRHIRGHAAVDQSDTRPRVRNARLGERRERNNTRLDMQVVKVISPVRIGLAQPAQRTARRLARRRPNGDKRSSGSEFIGAYDLKSRSAGSGDCCLTHADGDELAAYDRLARRIGFQLAPMGAQQIADAQLSDIGQSNSIVHYVADIGRLGGEIRDRRQPNARQLRMRRRRERDNQEQKGGEAVHGDPTFDEAIFVPAYHGRDLGRNHRPQSLDCLEMTSAAEQTRSDIVALLPRLRRFARALTGQLADADDIVQVAVERALMRIDQFQAGTRLDSWLFSIVRNAWIDEARSRSRRGKVFAPAELGEQIGNDGVAEAHAKLEADEVWVAMKKLPDEQREAVALVCVEGLPYREAAEALGVPIGTLTSRLARGREALQIMLGGAR